MKKKLRRASKGEVVTTDTRKTKGGGESRITKSVGFEPVTSGGWVGMARAVIRIGYVHPTTYNSAQAEVGGEIPFAVPEGSDLDEALSLLDEAIDKVWDKVDEVSDVKAEQALDALGLNDKK